MRPQILIVDTYYQEFLTQFWKQHVSQNESLTYQAAHDSLMGELFGTSDFYSTNLKTIGVEAKELIFNDPTTQLLWATENESRWQTLMGQLRRKPSFTPEKQLEILSRQIELYRPEILYVQDLLALNQTALADLKRKFKFKLLVGQIASAPPDDAVLKEYDLIITSFPHFVEKFRKLGVRSEYVPLAFESSVVTRISKRTAGSGKPESRDLPLTFIGGLGTNHASSLELLERLANQADLQVWGYGADAVPDTSPIKKRYRGQAWGSTMYRLLGRSQATFNRHLNLSGQFANNMRLFEATGMGALLITDQKQNLRDFFEPGKEVLTYSSVEDLDAIAKLIENEPEQVATIAAAGQLRTLQHHSYAKRIPHLWSVITR